MKLIQRLGLGILIVLSALIVVVFTACTGLKSGDVSSVCENALVKQTVVIAAALARNVPVERYVDGLCKIAEIAEPFLIEPLKPADPKGTVGAVKYDPVERSLSAARERGLVE